MMKLAEWIKSKNLTLEEAAARFGAANGSVVERWANGKQLPRPLFMQKIFAATEGLVRPDDFYDLPISQNSEVRHAQEAA
jgi:transcriptional regulator with XRE-family HTH domain